MTLEWVETQSEISRQFVIAALIGKDANVKPGCHSKEEAPSR